jgi:hypothetical protein
MYRAALMHGASKSILQFPNTNTNPQKCGHTFVDGKSNPVRALTAQNDYAILCFGINKKREGALHPLSFLSV